MDRVNRLLTLLATGLTALFFVLICAQVVSRYLLAYSITWSEEVSRYAFVWATFLGAGAVAGMQEHYAVTVIDAVLPQWARTALSILRGAVELAFALILLYFGSTWAARQWGVSTPVVEANQTLVYAVIPLFGAYLGASVFARLRRARAPARLE